MPLIIDTASTSTPLSEEEFRAWAATQTVFLSSEMGELGDLRQMLSRRLQAAGFNVVMFEDLGGRDENAIRAYTEGVARSTIYIGVIADRYGRMQETGRSPTHDEYRMARERGLRISVWVAVDGSGRQGDARDFVQEVQTFHTTGRFSSADDLADRVLRRFREIAADDLAPWVKVGDAVFRASVIRTGATSIEIEGHVRDQDVLNHLTGLQPDQWNRSPETQITTPDRTGTAQLKSIEIETRAMAGRDVKLAGAVSWLDGVDTMAAGTSGFSAEDLAEIGIRVGLLGEEPPTQLQGLGYGVLVNGDDPLADLRFDQLSEGAIEPIAKLLIIERLVSTGRAGRIDRLEIGPAHNRQRRIQLAYTEPQRYTNQEPRHRVVEGRRPLG